MHLYQGPNATIVISDDDANAVKWEIPKQLLCYYSGYFRDALLPNINEDDKHTLYFERSVHDAFCVIVRLMYTGIVNFDKAPTPTSAITEYLDFFHLGERLDIELARTKIDIISTYIERILAKDKDALTSAHTYSTFDLPTEHPMRLFIAEMCYKKFLISDSFMFRTEWDKIPGFWSTMLLASKQVVLDAGMLTKEFEEVCLESNADEDDEEGPEVVDTYIKQSRDLNAIITKELEEEKENFVKMRMDGQ